MLIYHQRIDLSEGFAVALEPKGSRLVKGKEVSLPGGIRLFQHLLETGQPLKCWCCGIEATCFISNKGQNNRIGPPVLDLFAETINGPVLMTRDHIIPRSYGGVNDLANLRMGCGPCNNGRGNELDGADIQFMRDHPELIGDHAKYTLPENITFQPKTLYAVPELLSKVMVPETVSKNERKAKKTRKRREHARNRKAASLAAKKNSLPPLTTMLVLALA